MFNLSTQEVVLSIENSPLINLEGLELNDNERVEEIAQMISGDKVTEEARVLSNKLLRRESNFLYLLLVT